MATLAQRVTEAMSAAGLGRSELAAAAGVSASAITQILDGSTQSLAGKTAAGLERATGYRAAWLANEIGEKLVDPDGVPPQMRVAGAVRPYPVVSRVPAGDFGEACDPYAPGVAEEWRYGVRDAGPNGYWLRVSGESMTHPQPGLGVKSYPPGSLVLVDPRRRSPVSGEPVIAKVEGDHLVTFKVYVNEDGNQWLRPINPQHPAIIKPFKVLGTVVGKWEDS